MTNRQIERIETTGIVSVEGSLADVLTQFDQESPVIALRWFRGQSHYYDRSPDNAFGIVFGAVKSRSQPTNDPLRLLRTNYYIGSISGASGYLIPPALSRASHTFMSTGDLVFGNAHRAPELPDLQAMEGKSYEISVHDPDTEMDGVQDVRTKPAVISALGVIAMDRVKEIVTNSFGDEIYDAMADSSVSYDVFQKVYGAQILGHEDRRRV